MACLYKELLL